MTVGSAHPPLGSSGSHKESHLVQGAGQVRGLGHLLSPAAVALLPRPGSTPHLVPGLQVPLQRLLGELADAQLAVLAGHHDAGPAEAHCHFHPAPVPARGRAEQVSDPRAQSLAGETRDGHAVVPRVAPRPGVTAAALQPRGRPRAGSGRGRGDAAGRPGAGGGSTRQSETAGAARRALPLAVALATVAGPAPGPGLEWAAAAARGAEVGRKLLRRLPTPPTRAALWAPAARGPAWARLLKGPRRYRATERSAALHRARDSPGVTEP